MSNDGTVSSAVLLYTYPTARVLYGPRLVFDGTNYVAVWDDNWGVHWGRINPSTGAAMDGNGIDVTSLDNVGDFAISRTGSYTAVVSNNLAYRVDATGTALAETPVNLPQGTITTPQQSIDGLLFFTQRTYVERPYENERVKINQLVY